MHTTHRLNLRGLAILSSTFLIMISLTWILIYLDADRQIASKFFLGGRGEWAYIDQQPWKWLYAYGTYPGLFLLLGCIVTLGMSLINGKLGGWRRYLLLTILTSILGGGILVNAVLKDHWGRPRPRQIEDFGGKWEYKNTFEPGVAGKGKSFPCGHCSMGFSFISLGFWYQKSRIIGTAGTAFGMVYGLLMSIARIGQGAHFLTDALWSLGIIFMTATILYFYILKIPLHDLDVPTNKKLKISTPWIYLLISAICGVMLAFFLTRRPVYEEFTSSLNDLSAIESIVIVTNIAVEDIELTSTSHESAKIISKVQGFGWPNADWKLNFKQTITTDHSLIIHYFLAENGYFSEKNISMNFKIPESLHRKTTIQFRNISEIE
ncbi:MAG: phosphatase PAP2 family protein [SAR324 cluster bacterium]|nr:phosphatase PAP2 family protein [SAR324 cluster bacterium]